MPAEHGTFLLPRSDYRIEHNWEVLGLRGTGSHDIVVEDVFVPAHRVQRTNNSTLEATPGRRLNTSPIYAIPFAQVFARAVSTAAIGALQGRSTSTAPVPRSMSASMAPGPPRTRWRRSPWPTR